MFRTKCFTVSKSQKRKKKKGEKKRLGQREMSHDIYANEKFSFLPFLTLGRAWELDSGKSSFATITIEPRDLFNFFAG